MKRILSIFLLTLIMFSVFAFGGCTAFADAEQLTVESLNVFSSFCEVKFNKEISEASVENIVVYDSEDMPVTAVNTLSNDKKTVNIKYETPLDITKAYTLKSGLITDEAKESVVTDYSQRFSFTVYWNEDFDGYETLADLENAGYKAHKHSGLPFSFSKVDNVGDVFALVSDENGGKKLSLKKGTPGWGYFITKANVSIPDWYTIDMDIDSGEGMRPVLDINKNEWNECHADNKFSVKFTNNDWEWIKIPCFGSTIYGQLGANGNANSNIVPPTGKFNFIYDAKKNADDNKGTLSIYYNMELAGSFKNLSYNDTTPDRFSVGAQTNARAQYIDNVRVYKSVIDAAVFSVKLIPSFTKVELNAEAIGAGQPITANSDGTEAEDISYVYEWYTSDTLETVFPDDWTKLEDSSNVHVVTEEETTKYIACLVTQKLLYGENEIVLKSIASNKIYGDTVAPKAENVRLREEKSEDGALTALKVEYDYIDPNIISNENDPNLENGTVFKWEKATKTGENADWNETTVTTDTYPISETDINYFLRCTVTVKNTAPKGDEAVPVTTANYTLPFAPVATVSFSQSGARVGSNLVGTYTYYDENGDLEKDTEYGWYRCDSINDDGTLVGSNLAYCVQSADSGKYLVFKVTPKTDVFPKVGETSKTEPLFIKKAEQSGGGSSGGSGGSGGSSITYKNEVSKDNFKNNTTVKDNENKDNVSFKDIENHWAKSEITKLAEMGIVNGTKNGYEPEGIVTRAQWAAMLARTAGLDTSKSYNGEFYDVNASDWYALVVEAIKNSGIMTGDGANFRPNDSISRQEMAKSVCDLYEYLKKTAGGTPFDVNSFNDSDTISEWAVGYVEKACGLGLMKGDEKGAFNGNGSATRAEAAVVLIRVIEAK